MPVHAVTGHLVVILAPFSAVLALVYALGSTTRRALRWPLLATGAVTFALVVWAGEAGGQLWDELKAAAQASGRQLPAAVQQHAEGSDSLAVAVAVLGGLVLATVCGVLRPGRPPSKAATIASAALVIGAVAVLVTTATVLAQAMQAVWSTHGLWPA